ncbi:PTPLA-domain-containing protein, partial [Aureobasidium melanogenum]
MADRPQQPARPARERKSSPVKTGYLVLYNAVSTILWATILGRVLLVSSVHGTRYVFPAVGEFAKWTQTLALLEVVHAAVGIVRAPLFTTLMQVASRILLIWGIVYPFPNTVAFSPIYSSMLIAWSVTEVIRYSYFAINLSAGSVPAIWMWLRYNTFFVLYPLGISSE